MSKLPEIGDELVVVNVDPLPGNEVAPKLTIAEVRTLRGIMYDKKGNPHYDVGLQSYYNYISSYETKEQLKDGDKIHWCHPSRFITAKG
jgi:hypothetical protein